MMFLEEINYGLDSINPTQSIRIEIKGGKNQVRKEVLDFYLRNHRPRSKSFWSAKLKGFKEKTSRRRKNRV